MERSVVLWDDDIGWCERLRKELERDRLFIEEAENSKDLRQCLIKYEESRNKREADKGNQSLEPSEKEILAVLLSEQKMMEELSKNWQEFLRELCGLCVLPVLLVGEARDDLRELEAFSLGVSDYIERDKDIRVCAARIFASVGMEIRYQREEALWELVLDEEVQQLHCGDLVLHLTKKESLVLSRLLAGRGSVVPRKELLFAAWGTENPADGRVLDTVIKQLRFKFRPIPYDIWSKYGVGYEVKRILSKNA